MMTRLASIQALDGGSIPLGHKLDVLNTALRGYLRDGLLIAFSGGVDSALLLWAAEKERRRSGGRLRAMTTTSASFSAAERADVESFLAMCGVDHIWRESQELLDPAYLANDRSRCFHCKTELFRICHEIAGANGLGVIAYGYNASDRGDFRPGHQAAIENGIVSPLADAELSKTDIREIMRREGFELADKPASPCLSSRLMTGVPITTEKLREVEELEKLLREEGLHVFRVRVHESNGNKLLRLEVDRSEMELAFALHDRFAAAARERGFRWVTLDLEGYKTGGANA